MRPSEAELERRRAFLQTFRRWEILFKRRNGESEEAEKWLIAEYYDSLKHLSEAGFEVLTRQLKEKCIFFPTIRECLELTKPSGPYDWGHPFLNKPELLAQNLPSQAIRYTPAVEHNQAGDPE